LPQSHSTTITGQSVSTHFTPWRGTKRAIEKMRLKHLMSLLTLTKVWLCPHRHLRQHRLVYFSLDFVSQLSYICIYLLDKTPEVVFLPFLNIIYYSYYFLRPFIHYISIKKQLSMLCVQPTTATSSGLFQS